MEIDSGAMRHILDQTNELEKLSIRNTSSIDTESIGNLINIISDLIKSMPPRLKELDLTRIEGSASHGEQILEALYNSQLQISKLSINFDEA